MDQQPTTNVKHDPPKASGSTALCIIGFVAFAASLFTVNLGIIIPAFVVMVLLVIAADSLQTQVNIETYLSDIREASNLQTNRLDVIAKSLMYGGEIRKAAQLTPQLLDVVSEARDLLTHMQPDLPVDEGDQ